MVEFNLMDVFLDFNMVWKLNIFLDNYLFMFVEYFIFYNFSLKIFDGRFVFILINNCIL